MPASLVLPVSALPAKLPAGLIALKHKLDELLGQYHNRAFIADDPMRLPHRFREQPLACELSAFLAAMLAYGRRETILATLDNLLERLEGDPWAYLQSFSTQKAQKDLRGFYYRFNTGADTVWLLSRLHEVYQRYGSLEGLFMAGSHPHQPVQAKVSRFCATLSNLEGPQGPKTYGQRYFIPQASAGLNKGGACKRVWLFLRWVVRCDAALSEPVDFGLWQNATAAGILTPAQLLIPLDTHVGRLARELGLLNKTQAARTANDWQTAAQITQTLSKLNPTDPALYDFALLGLGVDQSRGRIAIEKPRLGTKKTKAGL